MTVPVVDPPTTAASDATAPAVPAQWAARAGAFAADTLPVAAVLGTMTLVALSVPLRGVWWWVCVSIATVAVLSTVFNRLLPVIGAQSLGRAVFGITVVRRNNAPAEPWWLLLRELLHLLDTAPVLAGWLWPLWDPHRHTFRRHAAAY